MCTTTTTRVISWKDKIRITDREQNFSTKTFLVEMPSWHLVTWPWLTRALITAMWEHSKLKQKWKSHRVRVSSYYALEYQKTDTERMLKCYAFLTYPAPRISWVQGNTSIQETDWQETRDGVLYSLRSDQNIINTADPYYCHIHLPHEEWAAEWKMQGNIF